MPPSALAKAATYLAIWSRTSRRLRGVRLDGGPWKRDLRSKYWPSGWVRRGVRVMGWNWMGLWPPAADVLDGAEGAGDGFVAAEFVDERG